MQKQIQIQIKVGASVQYKHGQMAAVVKYLVANPYNGQITQLVIDRGRGYTSLKLVDTNKIADTTYNRETVRLTVTQEQFGDLPDFIESDFVSAPSPFGGSSRPFYQGQGQGKDLGRCQGRG